MNSPRTHGDVPETSGSESLAPAKKAGELRGDAPWGPRTKYIFVSPVQPGREVGPERDLGLVRRLVAADAYARFQRHRTPDVWFPIGVDGFGEGLPAEASRRGLRPEEAVRAQCDRTRSAARALAVEPSGDFVSTSDPSYVRLTQWIFLELLAKGLVRWADCRFDGCPACGGRFRQGAFASCPRCGAQLERREVRERRLDIAAYGDRLLGDLEGPERRGGPRSGARRGAPDLAAHRSVWSPRDRKLQRQILGRVKGCEVRFPVSRPFELEYRELVAFTTRVELLYGVTFILVEPYHPLLPFLVDAAYEEEVERYRERLRKGSEPRISAVRTGGHALNPLSLERVPILASALAWAPGAGGVVLGIPGHDAELFELAKRLRLPVREVVHSDAAKFDHRLRLQEPWLGDGVLTNSGPFCGLSRKVARERVISALARKGACRKVARFRFASLPVSAEATWGPPVPVVRCPACGDVPVPDAELPL
ncbi:MAG: class I tRNA ligase family protein, partial [Planctomycetota bacterium]